MIMFVFESLYMVMKLVQQLQQIRMWTWHQAGLDLNPALLTAVVPWADHPVSGFSFVMSDSM